MGALLTCVFGGCLALACGDFFCWLLHKQFAGFAQAVFGMMIRGGVSLGACALVYGFGLPASQHGFVFYVLVFYMITLSLETVMAVRQFSDGFAVTESAGEQG